MSLKISCLIILSDRQMVRFTPELGGWGGGGRRYIISNPLVRMSPEQPLEVRCWHVPSGQNECPQAVPQLAFQPRWHSSRAALARHGAGGGELLGPAHARLLCQAVFAQKLLVRLARMATQGSPCPASCPVISQGCYLPSTNTPPALLPPPQLPLPTALHWQTPYLCIFPVSQSGSIINVNG